MQKVFLICGVPGSGKSWVCDQLKDRFHYIAQDDFIEHEKKTLYASVFQAAKTSSVPILVDCPFGERPFREELRRRDLKVVPVFVVEHPDVVKRRYESRGKPVYAGLLTRALSIADRAQEWNAFWGTSQQVLEYLRKISYAE